MVAASGTILTWWHEKSKRDEQLDATLEWILGNDCSGERDYFPTVIIHNRSSDSVAVSDVELCWGWSIRKRSRWTALDYDDPEDLAFPYVVEPGKFWRKRITNQNFAEKLGKVKLARFVWFVKRPSVWIRVKTMRGTTRYISAMSMIESFQMPDWLKEKGLE